MDMDIETRNHLPTLRKLLLYRLAQLQQETATGQAGRGSDVARAGAADPEDDETERARPAGVGAAGQGWVHDELTDVRRALQRLDDGLYGDCTDCGKAITLPGLMAQPATLRCAGCQALFVHDRHGPAQA